MYCWYHNDRLGPSQHASSQFVVKEDGAGKYPQDQHELLKHHYTVLKPFSVFFFQSTHFASSDLLRGGSGDGVQSRCSTTPAAPGQQGWPSPCRRRCSCRSGKQPGSAPAVSGLGSHSASSCYSPRSGRLRSDGTLLLHKSREGKKQIKRKVIID